MTNNVADIMELVNDWDSLQNGIAIESVIIPTDRLRAIEKKCSTKRETANECASYYVQCNPLASWTHLANRLYECGEFVAVDKLKPHLPLRGKHLVAMMTSVYMEINHFYTCSIHNRCLVTMVTNGNVCHCTCVTDFKCLYLACVCRWCDC